MNTFVNKYAIAIVQADNAHIMLRIYDNNGLLVNPFEHKASISIPPTKADKISFTGVNSSENAFVVLYHRIEIEAQTYCQTDDRDRFAY